MHGEAIVNDMYKRALELANEGRAVEAIEALKEILDNHATTCSQRSMIYNDAGSILYSRGDAVNGEEFIKRAVFTDLFNLVAYRNLKQVNALKVRKPHKFSIVISTFNRVEWLKKCVESIRNNSYFPLEILVVCDPCKDGTEDYLASESEKGDLIPVINEEHLGVTVSTNKGLLRSTGDYICILNDDVEVMPGWDLAAACTIDADPSAGCAVPLVISEEGTVANPGSYWPYKSLHFSWIGKYTGVDPYCVVGNTLENFPDFQVPRECDYGIFPVMKRECYEKVGGLDLQFAHYCADPDLGYRIQQQGYKNIYCPTSVIMHCWMSNHKGVPSRTSLDEPKFYEKWALTQDGVKMTDMFKAMHEGQAMEMYNTAVALATDGKFEEALGVYRDIIKGQTVSRLLISFIYNDIGSILYSSGCADLGEEFVKKAIFTECLNTLAYKNLMNMNSLKVKKELKFSIIIPACGGEESLKKCITSVRNNGFFSNEIIVICDPCKDGVRDYLSREIEKGDLIILNNERRIGTVESANKGLLKSSGDYICILGDDAEVMPGWDLSIVCTIDEDPLAGCAAPLVISEKGLILSSGTDVDVSRVSGKTLDEFPELQSPRECDYAVFPVMKRECLDKVVGFDTRSRKYSAGPDLGHRVREAGYKNIYCPTSVVVRHLRDDHDAPGELNNDEAVFCNKRGLTQKTEDQEE
ncbi:MAG: glycosyltransferase family 2 protein [Nitrospiraceae bacterium]|nr:MAG: glycosyltransferase family 2 protein [Nitrospiraceae bacterium]